MSGSRELLCASCCNSLGQVHKSPVNAMGVHTVTLNGHDCILTPPLDE